MEDEKFILVDVVDMGEVWLADWDLRLPLSTSVSEKWPDVKYCVRTAVNIGYY